MGAQIRSELGVLKQRVTETGLELERCRNNQEAFSVEYHMLREQIAGFNTFVEQNGEQHPDCKKHRAKKELLEKQIKEAVSEIYLKHNTIPSMFF